MAHMELLGHIRGHGAGLFVHDKDVFRGPASPGSLLNLACFSSKQSFGERSC